MTEGFASAGFASLFALVFAVPFAAGADWVCAGAARGANKTIESAMAKALDENRRRVVIWTPLGELFSFLWGRLDLPNDKRSVNFDHYWPRQWAQPSISLIYTTSY